MSPATLTQKEKAERIAQLRMINSVARKHLPKEFCDEVDEALLDIEDVCSDAVN
jgi:predicted Zn-dependent protease with MMP-like domain